MYNMRTKKSVRKKRTNNSTQRRRKRNYKYQSGSGGDGPDVGKFYVLKADMNGFRPLYLTLENIDDSFILAWSCPPINYPELNYYVRGMQQDALPKSILNEEVNITEMTKRGGDIILRDADGYYSITLSNSWVKENKNLWKYIKINYGLR